MGLFSNLVSKITGNSSIAQADWLELEKLLLESDLGRELTSEIILNAQKIKENPEGDYSQEKIDEAVESRVDDAKRNPMDFLRDFGWEDRFEDFIDVDKLKEDYISN